MLRYLLFVIWLLSASMAHAQLTILICGSATSTGPGDCSTPDAKVDSNVAGSNLEAVKVYSEADTTKALEVILSGLRAYPTPPGWTPPAPGSIEPVPPSTGAAPVTTYSTSTPYGVTGGATSAVAACAAGFAGSGFAGGPHYTDGGPCLSGTCFAGATPPKCVLNYDGAPTGTVALGNAATCAAGYTNVIGTCTLSDASLVQKPSDGRCALARVGNSYSTDANDPDCAAAPTSAKSLVNGVASGGTVTASGGGRTVTVAIGGDGTVTVTTAIPSGGSTVVTAVKGGAPDGTSGNVPLTGVAQATSAGTGSENNPAAPVDACGGPGQPMCNVRVSEAGTPSGAAAFAGAGTALDTASTARETAVSSLAGGGAVTSLPGFSIGSWLPSAGTCAPFHWDFKGYVYDHDWCPMLTRLRALWAWVVGIIGALYVWRRATSPQQAA